MVKLLATVRTLFLVFIIGYTARATPLFVTMAGTFDEQYNRCTNSVNLLTRAAWLAVAWIALEVLFGWLWIVRAARKSDPAAGVAAGEPPFAPPGHR